MKRLKTAGLPGFGSCNSGGLSFQAEFSPLKLLTVSCNCCQHVDLACEAALPYWFIPASVEEAGGVRAHHHPHGKALELSCG